MVQFYKRKGGEFLVNTESGGNQSAQHLDALTGDGFAVGSDTGDTWPPGGMIDRSPPSSDTTSIVHAVVTDVILNADRTRMYIARQDGIVTVYDTFTGQILNNFQVGARLGGIDLSADGSFLLAVEDSTVSAPGPLNAVIYKIDVATGAVTNFTKAFDSIDGPFHDVALFADGTAITTTTLRGSGATTTYRLDSNTGVFTQLVTSSAEAPIVTASANRLHVLLTNGFNVSGPNQMYDLAAENVVQQVASRGVSSSGASLHAFTADGSLVAYVERQAGVDIFDSHLNYLTTLAGIQGVDVRGIAFDDHGDYLYLLLVSTHEIVKIAASDWSVTAHIPVGNDVTISNGNGFDFGGTLAVGPDAQYLTFISIVGVELFRIDNPTAITPVQGTNSGETMNGTGGPDVLYGLDGDDTLNGGGGDDTLRGGAGNDTLDGGTGHDAMYGGDGDDIYYVDDVRDRAAEASAAGGSDEVRASVSFALEGNVERLVLTGAGAIDGTGNASDNSITGNDSANKLYGMGGVDLLIGAGGDDLLNGGTGADDMRGGQGNDIYVVDNVADIVTENGGEGSDEIQTSLASYSIAALVNIENLTGLGPIGQTLTGNAGNNVIRGGNGNDVIDGGSGQDMMIGGSGNDIYYVDDTGDTVVENVGGGSDEVRTSLADYTIPDNVEKVTVIGGGAHVLHGNSGPNFFVGGSGADTFFLEQGGNDFVQGGDGDDGFFFGAAFTAGDRVDGGPGTNDQIGLQGDYTGASALTLGVNTIANVEAIVVLPGFSYNITTADANVAAGGVLKVQATQLAAGQSLTFNGSAETDGSFMIFGGQGNDNFTGGAGNDGFYFGPGGFNGSDIVNGGAGTNDQLALDGDYTITLGGNVTNVEVLVLLHGPSGTPNHFNVTAGDAFVPSGQTMIIFGLQVETAITFDGSGEHDGAFKIYGGLAGDAFTGSTGDDWMFGGGGGDTMTGGAGADTFYYDDASQSTSLGFDRLVGFDDSADKIDLPFAVTGLAGPASGSLSTASFDTDLAGAFGGLTSHQAGVFTATGGDMAGRTFLVIDADGNAGYQAGADYVIEIVTPVTPIDNPAMFI